MCKGKIENDIWYISPNSINWNENVDNVGEKSASAYYSYSYSAKNLNPNIIRICIQPKIWIWILFVFVFAHKSESEYYSYSYSVPKKLFAHIWLTSHWKAKKWLFVKWILSFGLEFPVDGKYTIHWELKNLHCSKAKPEAHWSANLKFIIT